MPVQLNYLGFIGLVFVVAILLVAAGMCMKKNSDNNEAAGLIFAACLVAFGAANLWSLIQ